MMIYTSLLRQSCIVNVFLFLTYAFTATISSRTRNSTNIYNSGANDDEDVEMLVMVMNH